MTTYTDPPRWIQAAVSSLLPPAYREPVLGDLHERFSERRAHTRWLGYAGDVLTTVPQVLRSQIRRIATRGSLCAAAASGDLRTRAEQLQMQIWIRNAAILFSVFVVIGSFLINARGSWHFNDSVTLAMTIGWICAAWRTYGASGRSASVPAGLPWNELHAFHRGELIRQMNLGYREFFYCSLPAVLLILYGLATHVPRFRGGWMLLGAIALQNCAIAAAHRIERRRYQRELDRLNQEVEPA